MHGFVDRTQTEPLILQFLVHTLNECVQLRRIRHRARYFLKKLVLLMSRNESVNRNGDAVAADLGRRLRVLSYHS